MNRLMENACSFDLNKWIGVEESIGKGIKEKSIARSRFYQADQIPVHALISIGGVTIDDAVFDAM